MSERTTPHRLMLAVASLLLLGVASSMLAVSALGAPKPPPILITSEETTPFTDVSYDSRRRLSFTVGVPSRASCGTLCPGWDAEVVVWGRATLNAGLACGASVRGSIAIDLVWAEDITETFSGRLAGAATCDAANPLVIHVDIEFSATSAASRAKVSGRQELRLERDNPQQATYPHGWAETLECDLLGAKYVATWRPGAR